MRNTSHRHTILAYTAGGTRQTLVRKGHVPARANVGKVSAESVLKAAGVSGRVTIRHHEAAMFGKPGRLVAVIEHEVV